MGKGKAFSLSIAPRHLGNGQAGPWLHLTHQPQHLNEGGRTAAVDILITATTHSRAVVPKGKQMAFVNGSRAVGNTVTASPFLSATPQPSQLTCSRLCCQHQPESGSLSKLPHESPYLAGMKTLLLPPSLVYGDAKSSLKSGCAAFSGKKKIDINSSWSQ